MKFSLLVPRKADHGIRDYHWSLVKKRYKEIMPKVEICTGYDKSELFCRSKAVNRAAKKATGDIFIMVDADVIFEPRLLEKIAAVNKGQLINVMKRECFEAVQGLDERFKGWGLEDFAFRLSLDTICGKHFIMDQNVYHLWHPRAKRNHINASNNKNLYLRYLKAADDLMEMKMLISERFK